MRSELSALLAEIVAAPDVPVPEPAHRLRPGLTVGRFRLLRELGRGGFGEVYEALDAELGRRVAFKALRPSVRARDPGHDELLRREAMAVGSLQHPNIVTLHDAGIGEQGRYLILELLRGRTLADRLARSRLSSRDAVRVALAIAAALEHAHGAGVLHRDLKPANVFLTADGGVKVLDFGLAHALGREGPRGAGTPGYLAPEQRRGGVEDARTDLFSFGVLIAEMVTSPAGRPTAAEDGVAVVDAEKLPLAFRALVRRLTDPDPARRPRGAAEVRAELRRVAEGLDPPAGGPGAPGTPAQVEALRQLFLAEQCAARPLFGQDCAEGFRRAIALDPTLASAHYQLAVWTRLFNGTPEAQRASMAQALRHVDRAPPLERLLIPALAAQLDGQVETATRLLREAAEAFPSDPRPAYELGDLLRHEDELELCLPWLEQAVARQPDHGWALGELPEVLGALGRTEALRAWLPRWEAAPSPATLHALSCARGWLGDLAGAEEAARRAVALGAGLVAQLDLLGAWVMAGHYGEAEAGYAALAEPGSPVRRLGFYARAALQAYRGRRRAGLEALDRLVRELPEAAQEAQARSIRIDFLLGGEDPGPVRREVEALRALDPRVAAEHAPALAWLGDLEAARALGGPLRPGSALARALEAILAVGTGDVDGGLERLAAAAADAPIVTWRLSPLWLLGDVAARAGRDDLALRALERFEALHAPRFMWRSWAHARALLGIARLRARRGDHPGAEAALARVEAERAGGDPDDAVLAAARELRAGLVAAR